MPLGQLLSQPAQLGFIFYLRAALLDGLLNMDGKGGKKFLHLWILKLLGHEKTSYQ